MHEELWKEISDFQFAVNEWGSCQYAGALSMYRKYFELRERMAQDEVWRALGIKVQHPATCELSNLKEAVQTALKEQYNCMGEILSDEIVFSVANAKTVDDVFHALRSDGWDLWSAAEFVSSHLGIRIDGVPDAPGVGPTYNVLAQQENYRTGLYCAILKDLGFVENEESFKNFDT